MAVALSLLVPRSIPLAVAMTLCALSSAASAQTRGADQDLGLLFVEATPPTFGAAGILGLAVGVLPLEWLGLRAGASLEPSGVQGTWTLDAYLPLGRQAIGIELGSSVGPYEYGTHELFGSWGDHYEWTLAHRGHIGLSARFRSGRRWWVRLFTGYRRVLNPGDARCIDSNGEPCDRAPTSNGWFFETHLEAIYAGGAFAYTFDP